MSLIIMPFALQEKLGYEAAEALADLFNRMRRFRRQHPGEILEIRLEQRAPSDNISVIIMPLVLQEKLGCEVAQDLADFFNRIERFRREHPGEALEIRLASEMPSETIS